jgi:Prokaryotic N-terminal methylation motif
MKFKEIKNTLRIKNRPSELGLSLVEIMMAMSIFSIVIAIVFDQFKRMNLFSKQVEQQAVASALLRDIVMNLDCRKTLGVLPSTPLPVACNPTTKFTLIDKDGKKIGRTNKDWNIFGVCNAGSLSVQGIPAKASKNAPVAKDREMFGKKVELCSGMYATNPSTCPAGSNKLGNSEYGVVCSAPTALAPAPTPAPVAKVAESIITIIDSGAFETVRGPWCFGGLYGTVPQYSYEPYACDPKSAAKVSCPAGKKLLFDAFDRAGWAGMDLAYVATCY